MSDVAKAGGAEMLRPEDVFTEAELNLWKRLLAVVDRNPVLDPRADSHNSDFFEVGGHVEITRDGMLKIRKLANYSCEIKAVNSVEYKGDLHVTVVGRIIDEQGWVEEVGGCSWSEVAPRKAAKDTRIYNDVVTRAATRMEKRAVENKVGLPFVNMLIKSVFGGFEIRKQKAFAQKTQKSLPESVGGTTITYLNSILKMLREARDDKVFTGGEMAIRWNGTQGIVNDPAALKEYHTKIMNEIEERRHPSGR